MFWKDKMAKMVSVVSCFDQSRVILSPGKMAVPRQCMGTDVLPCSVSKAKTVASISCLHNCGIANLVILKQLCTKNVQTNF